MRGAEGRFYGGGLVLVSVLALIDAALPVSFVGVLLLGVFVASLAASPGRVGIVGAYAFGWAAVLGVDGDHWSGPHWFRLLIVAVGTSVAVLAAIARERQHAALIRTANVADVAQRALLRPLADRYDGVEIAMRYLSADDGALIGGDVYDIEASQWGLRVLIADVCGHGLEAVEKASVITFAFREAAHTCETLEEVVIAIETSFRRQARAGDFATALLLEINEDKVLIANCGHPDPGLIGERSFSWVAPDRRSRPIGLGSSPSRQRLLLAQGQRLLVYTDGIIEARDAGGTFFDLETCANTAFRSLSLDDALDHLFDSLRDHTGGPLHDDVIALAVAAHPGPSDADPGGALTVA
jgi:phosphoserine phosphatase RsbU/P